MNIYEIIKNIAKPEEQIAEAGEDVIVARGVDIKNVDENKLASYAVLFTDKDNPDLTEDYFTADNTDVDLETNGKSSL